MVVWRGRMGRCGSPGSFRRATCWGWYCVRKRMITLRACVFGHRLESEMDILFRRDQHVVIVDGCAPVERV